MWKKAAWVYVVIYLIGVSVININSLVSGILEYEFDIYYLMKILAFLVPGALVILDLLDMLKSKFTAIYDIVGFLFIAVMTMGTLAFNTVGFEMFAKALLFIPMLGCLGYYIYTKLVRKNMPATNA